MATHNINGTKIHTNFDYPPIPVRDMDWSAVTDDYDCDCDQDGFFSTHPVGRGATEQEAIADLLDQLGDQSLDSSSAVERLAVNEDVAGSKPAYPAISRKELIENSLCCLGFGLCVFATLTWGLL